MTINTDDAAIERRLRGLDPPDPARTARLHTRLAEQASSHDLLDVAFARLDSPIGALLVSATVKGLVRLAFDTERDEDVLDELARRVSPRVLHAPARLDAVRRELDEYFAGTRTSFDLALDWAMTGAFRRAVLEATARIPYGETRTYRAVAEEAGNDRAVRAAGTALATNPIPIVVPCHRVLRSDGGLGGYRGGVLRKEQLLRLEEPANGPVGAPAT